MRSMSVARRRARPIFWIALFGVLAGCSPQSPAQGVGAPTGVTASTEPPAAAVGLSALPEADTPAPPHTPPAPPVDTQEGELEGSSYRVDVPDSSAVPWNHILVVYFHGYQSQPQLFRPDPTTHRANPPSRVITQLLLRGYAVAQPGYEVGGWAIATAETDAETLADWVAARYGAPKQTFVLGQSMGGLLTVLLLEQHPSQFSGGLSICGVLAPADLVMQRAFANRVAFDAFFPGILPDVEHIPPGFHMNDPVIAAQVQKALDAHPAEAALLRSLADIHTNRGLADVLVFNTFVIQDLRSKSGGNPFDNRNLIYTGTTDDNALNAKVRRYSADPSALAYVARYGSPTGELRRPLLALHTIYDPLVPASTAGYYDELTRRLGNGRYFVQQYVDRDGHCNVTPDQVGMAFDELQAWVDTGTRPAAGRLPDTAGQKPVHQQPAAKPVQPRNIGKPQ